MVSHISWIKDNIRECEKKVQKAKDELHVWTEALKLASDSDSSTTKTKSRYKIRIVDVVLQLMGTTGSVSNADIVHNLHEVYGISTTANSVNTCLKRYPALVRKNPITRLWESAT